MKTGRVATGTRARGAARVNLAGALGSVWTTLVAPGSILLTLFMKDWLQADKWQIGLMMTMTFLGPTFEPIGACCLKRIGSRRHWFMTLFLAFRTPYLLFALVPFLPNTPSGHAVGITLILVIVGCSRVPAHLGNPAWWSWMADLVPERRRARFFSYRVEASSAVAAFSFVVAMLLLHFCGGLNNRSIVSGLFAVAALFGIVDILLFRSIPEPGMRSAAAPNARNEPGKPVGLPGIFSSFAIPFREPSFRCLILGAGLWSFSANLVLPFLPVYQHGERIAGQMVGLALSWKFLAVATVAGSVAGMLTSRAWGQCSRRFGPRPLIFVGSGYLFVNLVYFLVMPEKHLEVLVLVAFASGALNAAWTIGVNQLLLTLAPRDCTGTYVSAFNFTNGWLMAGGPLLGGLLADQLPLLGWRLPGGLPCCYFHVLLALGIAGGILALLVLRAGLPVQQIKEPTDLQSTSNVAIRARPSNRNQPRRVDIAKEYASIA